MAYEQIFKNIDNKLHTDDGCGSELDYNEDFVGAIGQCLAKKMEKSTLTKLL